MGVSVGVGMGLGVQVWVRVSVGVGVGVGLDVVSRCAKVVLMGWVVGCVCRVLWGGPPMVVSCSTTSWVIFHVPSVTHVAQRETWCESVHMPIGCAGLVTCAKPLP